MLVQKIPGWILLAASLTITLVVLYSLPLLFGTGSSEDFDSRPYLLAGATGLLLGVMFRDYGYAKNVKTLWPIEASVIDFAKVERLLWGESPRLASREEPLAAIPVETASPVGPIGDAKR
jgi:hypothetical protein